MSGWPDQHREILLEYLLRLADDRLVVGHRLSEWCGHGPFLEQDIALANIALDSLGQANNLLELASRVEGKDRSADDFAFQRDETEFHNLLLVEQPNGDFAQTIARQFFFDCYGCLLYAGLSKQEAVAELAGISAKALKEVRYHRRHSREWILRLGDGTEESHERIQRAINELWRFTGELFESDELQQKLVAAGIAPDLAQLAPQWRQDVASAVEEATLELPQSTYMQTGGRSGKHTEHLGHMLSEMQILPRSFPDAKW